MSSPEETTTEIRRLRWRCRRGMKELDDVLVHFLDHRYAAASESERAAFRRLLEFDEPDILAYLIGRERPADEAVASLVDAICAAYQPEQF